MTKFDMGNAWTDTVQLLRCDLPLTSAVAGMFVLLPSLAFSIFGPVPVEPAPGAELPALMENLRATMVGMAPWLIFMAFLSAVSGVAIMRLWLSPTNISVGEALGFAAALVPIVVLVIIVESFAVGFAAMLLVLPAIYLSGRWAPTYAILASGDTRNPIDALTKSWEMTRGNGWRIALMLILVQIVVFIVILVASSVGAVLGAPGSTGFVVASLVNSALAAGAALVGFAMTAAIYRQLSQVSIARAFE